MDGFKMRVRPVKPYGPQLPVTDVDWAGPVGTPIPKEGGRVLKDGKVEFGTPAITVGDQKFEIKNGELLMAPAYRVVNFETEGGTKDAIQRTEKEDSETKE